MRNGPTVLPAWFQWALLTASLSVLSFGGVGLLLAVLGRYHPLVAAFLGGTLLGALLMLVRVSSSAATSGRGLATVPTVAVCLIAVASALWNGAHSGEHVFVNQDPGVYLVGGHWIATRGDLRIEAAAEEWSGVPGPKYASPGFYDVGGGTLEIQFNHLATVLYAEAYGIGGETLMTILPAILGGFALCAVYAALTRLVKRPWLAVAGVAALAISLPQLHIVRDTFSEPSTQLLLWSGLWLTIIAYERRSNSLALVAGALFGGTVMTRIDALVYVVPLPLVAALAWLAEQPARRRRLAAVIGAFVAGLVPPVILGSFDLVTLTGFYYRDLEDEITRLRLALIGALGLSLALVLIWPRLGRARTWLAPKRRSLSILVGFALVALLVFGWAVRPEFDRPLLSTPIAFIEGLQRAEGVPVEPTRAYGEQTIRWMVWYLGPLTVAGAGVGAALLVARLGRRRDAAALLLLAVAGLGAALYLWSPNITPYQLWATRRFSPAAIPLFVGLAVVALDSLGDFLGRTRLSIGVRRLVLAVGMTGMLAFPVTATWPIREFETQSGFLSVVRATCGVAGRDSALLILQEPYSLGLPQSLRSWCDVPVAVASQPITEEVLEQLAERWREGDRRLWLVAPTPQLIVSQAPGAKPTLVGSATNDHEQVPSLTHAPDAYRSQTLTIWAAPMPR